MILIIQNLINRKILLSKAKRTKVKILLIPGNRSCGEPGIPFPWYKPKKLPGQSN